MALPSEVKLRASIDEKRRSDEWLGFKHIIAITKENLKKGDGPIQFLPQLILHGAKEKDGDGPIGTGKYVSIGKYEGKMSSWIKDNDFQYFTWLKENVKAYRDI